ncbi:MAG: FAD-dependent monooxygenase, partial [Chloroflexota bacterium]
MKALIVGGGPGGLYTALLLKKNNPEADVQLVERNPEGATYGWGVVFSDRTLNSFREADQKTYQQITDSFVLWPAIDTYYQDKIIRCDGHSFAGISRRRLLNILNDRGQELGVRATFETEVTDFSNFKDYDLVVAADGVNSFIRKQYEKSFIPTQRIGQTKFIWFGSTKLLDSFTFIFKENQHGLFQVHAYPFDGLTSTFIVECTEDVWRAAGLHKADETSSIAYCEELFSEFLQGSKLLSNKSAWVSFNTVKTKRWRHENIILLGDSALTAHFSIGSGTKLAMESAIALVDAINQKENMTTALKFYEMDRRPRTERLQQVAIESQTYFENIKLYLNLDPYQFTTNLLTRSGRIHYDNLRVRDPDYIDTVDRAYSQTDDQDPPMFAPPPMYTSFQLRGLHLNNRAVFSPPKLEFAQEGTVVQSHMEPLAQEGGPSLWLTNPVAVSREGRVTSASSGLYTEDHLEYWQKIVSFVHSNNKSKIGLTLNHAGRRASTQPRQYGLDRPLDKKSGWQVKAPSPIPYQPNSRTPKQLTVKEMSTIKAAFTRAAEMAQQADFDLLHLHFGHGYLLGSFLSPLTNQRKDKYGGTLEKRLRFPLEVFHAVRESWPQNKPISIALNADDWAKGGTTLQDAAFVAAALKDNGCDLIEFLAGQTVPNKKPSYSADFLTHYSDYLRHEVGIPTLVGGYLTMSGQ